MGTPNPKVDQADTVPLGCHIAVEYVIRHFRAGNDVSETFLDLFIKEANNRYLNISLLFFKKGIVRGNISLIPLSPPIKKSKTVRCPLLGEQSKS